MAADRYFGFIERLLGPPTMTFWWSLSLCTFSWNRCSSFDNMRLSIFCPFGLKTPIDAPKMGFSGNFIPKMASNVNETPKRHIFARVRVVWAIKRENPSTGLTCRWVQKKGINLENSLYFTHLPRSPHRRICTKFGTAVGAADVITCANFLVIGQGV